MKKCPYCGELIQDSAIKCRYCGEWLVDRSQTKTSISDGDVSPKSSAKDYNASPATNSQVANNSSSGIQTSEEPTQKIASESNTVKATHPLTGTEIAISKMVTMPNRTITFYSIIAVVAFLLELAILICVVFIEGIDAFTDDSTSTLDIMENYSTTLLGVISEFATYKLVNELYKPMKILDLYPYKWLKIYNILLIVSIVVDLLTITMVDSYINLIPTLIYVLTGLVIGIIMMRKYTNYLAKVGGLLFIALPVGSFVLIMAFMFIFGVIASGEMHYNRLFGIIILAILYGVYYLTSRSYQCLRIVLSGNKKMFDV